MHYTNTLSNMVVITGGSFIMGSQENGYPQERPAHQVEIKSFLINKYCVTVHEFFEFIKDPQGNFNETWCEYINPCFIIKDGDEFLMAEGSEMFPMVEVDFFGSIAYCNWLSKKLSFEQVYDIKKGSADFSKNGFRLLTEAEWEFACGNFTDTGLIHESSNFKNYNGKNKIKGASHNRIGGFGVTDFSVMPVGTFPPNEYGIYEMLGNVNEWCYDRYSPYTADKQINPTGASAGTFRVIRGGSFEDDLRKIRKSFRHAIHPQGKCEVLGFRLAMNHST